MGEHIVIRKAPGKWVVRAGGAVLGESRNALELSEGALAPVIYFPREDLAMAFFEKTEQTSYCPWKGDASYYSIIAKSGPIENAAWSYEDPRPGVAQIAGHLAFYTHMVTIEEL